MPKECHSSQRILILYLLTIQIVILFIYPWMAATLKIFIDNYASHETKPSNIQPNLQTVRVVVTNLKDYFRLPLLDSQGKGWKCVSRNKDRFFYRCWCWCILLLIYNIQGIRISFQLFCFFSYINFRENEVWKSLVLKTFYNSILIFMMNIGTYAIRMLKVFVWFGFVRLLKCHWKSNC
jgi:hypothetical protein